MPPTRRSGAAAQKKTLPSSHDEDVAFATSGRANSEFETELSGAFRLLSVEGSPSKVRTSDLGKLLRAIGAGEIAEMKPLENIVDINHSGFFTREKVRRFYRSLVQGNENFCRFAISVSSFAFQFRFPFSFFRFTFHVMADAKSAMAGQYGNFGKQRKPNTQIKPTPET